MNCESRWLENVPTLAGVENLSLRTQLQGPGAGAAVNVQLSSNNLDMLATAAEMADILRTYPSLRDV